MCDPRDSAPHCLFRGDAPRVAAFPDRRQISGAQYPQAFMQPAHTAQCPSRSANSGVHWIISMTQSMDDLSIHLLRDERREEEKGEKSPALFLESDVFITSPDELELEASSTNQLVNVIREDNHLPVSVCTDSISLSIHSSPI